MYKLHELKKKDNTIIEKVMLYFVDSIQAPEFLIGSLFYKIIVHYNIMYESVV